jgi:hypothetical protein
VIVLNKELVLPLGAGAVTGSEVRGRYLVLELGHVGRGLVYAETPHPCRALRLRA